jgi:hypothetical protein
MVRMCGGRWESDGGGGEDMAADRGGGYRDGDVEEVCLLTSRFYGIGIHCRKDTTGMD